jgi:flagellar biosynthetic protein FlhB
VPELEHEARTEEPTPHRLRELREEGRVAKGPDLTSAVMLVAAVLFLRFYGETLAGMLAGRIVELAAMLRNPPDEAGVMAIARNAIEWMLLGLGPLMAFCVGVAVISNVAQFGFVLSGTPIAPDIGKINPLNGINRMFTARTLVGLVMTVAKISVVSVVSYLSVRAEVARAGLLAGSSSGEILAYGAHAAFRLALALALALLVLGALDMVYQHHQFIQDHRMTKVEVREELRRLEGDPAIRARRRALQRRLSMQRMLHDVPEADVVVTNPTELAVALRYKAGSMNAPVVVAKGARLVASRIRELAAANGVPVVERPPLARLLYQTVDVGQEIPADLYKAVAEVLAYVYELEQMSAAA